MMMDYAPILSLKPAEMAALEELPDKDKDLIVPIIPIKRWSGSKELINSVKRVEKAIGKRKWIIDLDDEYLASIDDRDEGIPAVSDFKKLCDSEGGYRNWVSFIADNENVVPVIQLGDTSQIKEQLDNFDFIQREVVVRFVMGGDYAISPEDFNTVLRELFIRKDLNCFLFVLDYGDVDRSNLLQYQQYSTLVNQISRRLPFNTVFCISGTSFPYSFTGTYRGEVPIYERQIFNKVSRDCPDVKLVYSDRGSARGSSRSGGGGLPPARIDYPMKNDWRFIRKEINNSEKKEDLYQEAAIEMTNSDYWNPDLRLWGTQMIEKTCLGDPYAITSASRATAVRINIHLYQQLHYFSDVEDLDTEEDWED